VQLRSPAGRAQPQAADCASPQAMVWSLSFAACIYAKTSCVRTLPIFTNCCSPGCAAVIWVNFGEYVEFAHLSPHLWQEVP